MFVKYIEKFLTKEECESIISLGLDVGLDSMKSSRIVNGKVIEENVYSSHNKRMGCYFTNDLLELPILQSLSSKILTLSNKLNPFKGIEYKGIPKYSFNRYVAGDFLDWHPDSHEILNGATTTFIIQLNDEYDGGLVKYSINDVEHTIERKQGSVLIFDSNIMHSVDEVESGIRYSLNVWPSSIKKLSLI